MNVLHGQNRLPHVLVGTIGEENPTKPGLYYFSAYGTGRDGEHECYVIDDATLCSQDASIDDSGDHSKPTPGSKAVAVTGPGGEVLLIGFARMPKVNVNADAPTLGDTSWPCAEDTKDQSKPGQAINLIPGDKVRRTKGGSALIQKQGGTTIIQGGAGVQTQWLKDQNTLSSSAQNMNNQADGFKSIRGRVKPNKPDPETLAVEDFYRSVDTSSTRVRIRHGALDSKDSSKLRELTITDGVSAFSPPTTQGTLKTRETYFTNGNWVGEGPSYKWGGDGASENAVLGQKLKTLLNDLIGILQSFQVVCGPPGSPSPAVFATTAAKLIQMKVNLAKEDFLSDYIFLTKKPASLT